MNKSIETENAYEDAETIRERSPSAEQLSEKEMAAQEELRQKLAAKNDQVRLEIQPNLETAEQVAYEEAETLTEAEAAETVDVRAEAETVLDEERQEMLEDMDVVEHKEAPTVTTPETARTVTPETAPTVDFSDEEFAALLQEVETVEDPERAKAQKELMREAKRLKEEGDFSAFGFEPSVKDIAAALVAGAAGVPNELFRFMADKGKSGLTISLGAALILLGLSVTGAGLAARGAWKGGRAAARGGAGAARWTAGKTKQGVVSMGPMARLGAVFGGAAIAGFMGSLKKDFGGFMGNVWSETKDWFGIKTKKKSKKAKTTKI